MKTFVADEDFFFEVPQSVTRSRVNKSLCNEKVNVHNVDTNISVYLQT